MRIRALGVGPFRAVLNLINAPTRRRSRSINQRAAVAIAAASVFATVAPGTASAVLWTGSSGTLAASADFTFSGGTLTVILTNTSSADVTVESQLLTAVFFSIDTSATLTPVSAILTNFGGPGASTVFYDPDGQPAGGVVGGEWAYKTGLSGAPQGVNAGISSAGFSNSFVIADLFPGPNLAGPLAPDGGQYGILSAGDNTATGNAVITAVGGMIKNSVTFQLSGATADDFASIKDVSFQYGDGLSGPNLVAVPEPSSALLFGIGLTLLAGAPIRRRS